MGVLYSHSNSLIYICSIVRGRVMFDKKTSYFDKVMSELYYIWDENKWIIILCILFALCLSTAKANGDKIDPSIVSQNSTLKLQWYVDNYKVVTNENRILNKKLADYLQMDYDLKIENTQLKADKRVLEQQIKSEFIVNIPFTNIGIKKDHILGALCFWILRGAFSL